jgi:DmsE family decaheme c-type cytochrome
VKPKKNLKWPAILAALVVLLAFPRSGSGADQPDDETCLACHDGYAETLAGTAHALQPPAENVEVHCTKCHTGGSVHIEDPSVTNIGNPATMPNAQLLEICQQCHVPHAEAENIALDPHVGRGLSCVSCHSVHKGYDGLLSDDQAMFCGKCHVDVTASFRLRSNHPLLEDAVTCLSCHSLVGKNEPQTGHGPSANCYTCHPEQSGPYRYQHAAAISFAVEGGGCTECHRPHGSPNDRLLNQPASGLCLQCHGMPPGHRIEHSGLGSKLACVDCHSEIHGSNHNGLLLDPDLGVKLFPDCFQSGCHQVGN